MTVTKRDALIAAGKTGHKVLLFGTNLFGEYAPEITSPENATVDTVPFPQVQSWPERLATFSLVILDYAAFNIGGHIHGERQDIFEKQMIEALDQGTTFCFVHYNAAVPASDTGYEDGMSPGAVDSHAKFQIGFKWLALFSIKPLNNGHPIHMGHVSRGEFSPFLNRWGTSYNSFELRRRSKTNVDDVIYSLNENELLGFTIAAARGRLIYLPFQRDLSNKVETLNGLRSLIDSLLTYISKSLIETPKWAKEAFFEDELEIQAKIVEQKKSLLESESHLRPFEEAKALLLQSEYTLERTVPDFIESHLGIHTRRDNRHIEDFWLLKEDGEKAVISEVKSMVKGFRKSAIYDLYRHREENGLDESFPALLVANANLQAGSWDTKIRPIDKQDYELATHNNILILRVEDLVRLWDGLRQSKLDPQDIFEALTSSKGWLDVSKSFEMKLMI